MTKRIQPMPKEQFRTIVKAFEKNGGAIITDKNAQKILKAQNAEGITLDEKTILLVKNPSRSAVFEELIHSTQFRLGKNDGSMEKILQCELEAKEKLIRFCKEYELTQEEIEVTKTQSEMYREALESYRRKNI